MTTKKIFHIIQSLDNGGCENMLLRTLPELKKFNHTIITLKEKGELSKKFENKGVRIININQKGFLDLPAYIKMIKTIRQNNPHKIITYLFHADIIGRLLLQPLLQRRVVPSLRTTYNHRRFWIARVFERATKCIAKEYLANSESVKRHYVKKFGVSEKKITVIPNGISTQKYESVKESSVLKKELEIKPNETIITCVANLHINKGHSYLLKAFEEVFKENKNIKLLLVGDGTEKNNLTNQVKNYASKNNILFLGKRSDILEILKISNIFVLPTLLEGMSNALMEAMAIGLPCLTTNIPENEELLGNNGLYFSTKNSQEIKNQINKLIKDPGLQKQIGHQAQQYIINKYDLQEIANQWSKYLNK